MFKKKKRDNLLSMRPCLNSPFLIKIDGGKELLVMPRTSWVERVGIKWFHQVPEHRYQLDDLGSFVLQRCNGYHTVSEIETELQEEFGEKAEPTLNRLVKFLQLLDNNSVISFKKTGAD